jgi:hypothetical protein
MNNDPPGKEGWQRASSQPPLSEDNASSSTPSTGHGQASSTDREDRRNWANCFATAKTQDWMADFTGVVTMEDGSKFWLNVHKKLDKNRERYVAVNLKPWRKKGT